MLDERVLSLEISPRAVPLLSRTINNRVRTALQQIESELNDPRFRRSKEDGDERVRVGVGAYFFQEDVTSGTKATGERGSKMSAARRKAAGTSTRASGGESKKGRRR
jgi:ribosomal protein L31E